jgi:hypothetical protein
MIDKEMRPLIKWLNGAGYKTVACCFGHCKYPMTVIVEWRKNGIAEYMELFSGITIPRTRRFYLKDKQGLYYIPEVVINAKGE